jgi:cell wall-associated NlpC family hydrolase
MTGLRAAIAVSRPAGSRATIATAFRREDPMPTIDQVMQRALSMLGKRTVYWAGNGGTDPSAASPVQLVDVGQQWPRLPVDEQRELEPLARAAGFDVHDPTLIVPTCDCSGFVCWALGLARGERLGDGSIRWINTDSIHADAVSAGRRFRRTAEATVGSLVVYPKRESGERFGHVGIVTEVDDEGRARRVIHCSATNFKTPPFDAIQNTPPEAFERQRLSIYVWCQDIPML